MRIFFPTILLACTGENIIDKQSNSAPTILISSHSDGAEIQEGYITSFRAIVADDNNEFSDLQAAWYIGTEMICDWTEASLAGEVFCDAVFGLDDGSIIAEVRDPSGAGGRHEIEILVLPTEAPEVQILAPLGDNIYYANQLIQFSAFISDEEDDITDLSIRWSSSLDGELELDTTATSIGEISDYGYLTEGNHAIELRVEDPSGKTSTDEVVIQVGGENAIPTCSISEPSDGSVFISGEMITFRGMVDDEDIPATDLQVEWLSDKDGPLGSSQPSSDGSVLFAHNSLSNNTHIISLSVQDEVGEICISQIIVSVGHAPEVQIVSPQDNAIFSLGETISFEGQLSDSDEPVDTLQVEWSSDREGSLLIGNPSSQGSSQFTRSDLSAGFHQISLRATDESGLYVTDQVSIRVNNPPQVDSITLSPDPVYSTDDITATVLTSDLDNDPVTETLAWYENGFLTSFTGTSVPSSELDVGELWTLRVTPNDGYTDGDYLEASLTISNSGPSVSGVSISPSSLVYNDSVLTCSATVSDADETLYPSYSWDVDGTPYFGSTLDLATTGAMPTSTVICTASTADSQGIIASETDFVVVENRLPSITATVSAQGSGNTALLSCLGVAFDLDDAPTLPIVSYSWTNGQTVLGTNASLQLDASMGGMGDTIGCTATATDLTGATFSAYASYQISNSAPVISQISLSPSTALTNDTIVAAVTASDAENNSITFHYEWFTSAQSSSVQSGTSNTLDGALYFERGDSVYVRVTPSDNYSAGTPVDSSALLIENTPPEAPIIEITPASPSSSDDLVCAVIQPSADDDLDVSSYSYAWYQNGSPSVFSTSNTISSNDTQDGDSWECVATPFDGSDYGTPASVSTSVSFTCSGASSLDLGYDQLNFVIAHSSGGYLLAGSHNGQALVVMLDSFANILWELPFAQGAVAYHLVEGAGLNVVVGDDPAGAWVAAFDNSGIILWERIYPSNDPFEAVATDGAGHFYIGGHDIPAAPVYQIDNMGNIQWTALMPPLMYYVHSIEVIGAEVWAFGFQTNYPTTSQQSMMLVKLDAGSGAQLASNIVFSCGNSVAYGELSQPISNGDRIIAGSGNGGCSGNGTVRIAAATIDGGGAVTGQNYYMSSTSSGIYVHGAAASMNDDFWILGQYGASGLIINVDSSLTENWRLETIAYPRSAAIRPEGGMLVASKDGLVTCLSDAGVIECCGY